MLQSKNFGFGEEETMLRETARKFFADNLPVNRLHQLVASDPELHRTTNFVWDRQMWTQLVELGYTSLAVPEEAGGFGMKAVAVAAVCEEAGRVAFPGPLLSTFSTTCVLQRANTKESTEALTHILDGASATLAFVNHQGSWCESDTDVASVEGKLNGTAYFVQDAQKVDYFLVKAKLNGKTVLYWVAKDTEGVKLNANAIVDLTRDQAEVVFENARGLLISEDADGVLIEAMPAVWTLVAADIVGAGEWLLQTTVEYADQREQFDRKIGFFQAVKHPLVDLMVMIDEAKSLVYNAACALDEDRENIAKYAHMAKSSASDMALYSGKKAVQLHGGIGFTWECYVHIFFKRQLHSQMLWGDGIWHRERLARLLMST